jgi:hypothetical protein
VPRGSSSEVGGHLTEKLGSLESGRGFYLIPFLYGNVIHDQHHHDDPDDIRNHPQDQEYPALGGTLLHYCGCIGTTARLQTATSESTMEGRALRILWVSRTEVAVSVCVPEVCRLGDAL